MNGQPKYDDKNAATPVPRLYLRPDEAARAIGVSRRTLSTWQSARLIGFRRVGRTVLISVADILAAIERYRIAPIGEQRPPQHRVAVATVTGPPPRRKQRMKRTGAIP
jgi:excisionase family DNA binding protein